MGAIPQLSYWVFMTYSKENFTFSTFMTEENGKNQDCLQTVWLSWSKQGIW